MDFSVDLNCSLLTGPSGLRLRFGCAVQQVQQETSWVKKECEGGSGGSSDLCSKRDAFGHAQRLCSCIAPKAHIIN